MGGRQGEDGLKGEEVEGVNETEHRSRVYLREVCRWVREIEECGGGGGVIDGRAGIKRPY